MSEYGTGFAYCLGLFMAHAERDRNSRAKDPSYDYERWFNGASDHVQDLNTPDNFPQELKERIDEFGNRVWAWGHNFDEPRPTKESYEWSLSEAKDILMLIDKQLGVNVERGDWE